MQQLNIRTNIMSDNQVHTLSINGLPIKIVKDPHERIRKLKSLRIPHAVRKELENEILRWCCGDREQYLKKELVFYIDSLHELFFNLSLKGANRWLLQQTRKVFYKVRVLIELVYNASIPKMLEDGFFFKPLTNEDPRYLHQLFDVLDVIATREIKI